MNFAEYILSEGCAFGRDRLAVVFENKALTYGELTEKVQRFASVIRGAGAEKGDRIVILMGNRPDYYVAFLGAAWAGVICSTINVDYGVPEIAHMIRHADPVVIVADKTGADKYDAAIAASDLSPVTLFRVDGIETNQGGESLEQILATAETAPSTSVHPDDGVLMAFSSGSSGLPKPILTTHSGEIYASQAFRDVWRMNSADRVLVALALGWAYGIGTLSMPTLASGATIILLPKFRPDTVSIAIEQQQVTVFSGVTTMYRMILDYVSTLPTSPRFSSLRLAMTGGEKRNESIFAQFEDLAGVPVFDIYCQSEARPALGYDPLLDKRPVPGAAGRVFPGVEIELIKDDGSIAQVGEVGEMRIRHPNSFREYFGLSELTQKKRDTTGWVTTGDLFRYDKDGLFFLLGRKDGDMINRGGVKISPGELEERIATHPKVREVAVVGRPDTKYGEEVVACLVGDIAEEELIAQIRECFKDGFAEYKVPTHVVQFAELPRSANGKVDRRALIASVSKKS